MKNHIVLLATLLLATAAQSQTVWRCGADGRSYSDSPCPEGRIIAAADARTPAERQAARDVFEREQALAIQLTQQRHAREAQLPVMAGIRNDAAKRPALVKSTLLSKQPSNQASKRQSARLPAAPGTWQATAPASPRKPG